MKVDELVSCSNSGDLQAEALLEISGEQVSWAPVESGHGGERQVVPRIPEEYQLKVEIVRTLTFTSENRLWASGRTLADKPCDGVGGSNTQR